MGQEVLQLSAVYKILGKEEGDCLIYGGCKVILRWSEISRGLRKHAFLCFYVWDERMCSSPENGPQGSSAVAEKQCSPYKHLMLFTGELRCKPVSECYLCPLFSARSEQTPVFYHPWRRGGGNRSGSVSRWCGQVPTRLGWTIFSWCYPELGELPQEKSFLQRFFFYITS